MDKIIEITNLTKTYAKTINHNALNNINIDIYNKDFCAIIGESGSGKSTLINIIGTLDSPSSGTILFKNNDLNTLSKKDLATFRNQQLGFIFQFSHLINELTVRENIMIPKYIEINKVTKMSDEFDKIVKLVGIEHLLHKYPNKLSGGEEQKVAIARALINNPTLLLADEPTGNLDPKSTESIFKLFKKINTELETTVIVITHNINFANKFNRIITLYDGNIIS